MIIAGAGIGGTYAASMLAKKGIKTLIIEKEPNEHTSFCGEMVGIDTMTRLGISSRSDMVSKWYKNLKLVYLDNKFEISVPKSALKIGLLETQDVKKMFLKQALDNGAEVKFKTPVKSAVKKGDKVVGIKTDKGIFKSKIVIGADGSTGVIAKTAGFDVSGYRAMPSFRYKYKNTKDLDEDDAIFFVGREIGLGYFWVYPRANKKANIGIGAIANPNMTRFFKQYTKNMKELKGAKIYSKDGDMVPYSGILPEIARKGVALIGDCAGQVNSLVGGGVRSSTMASEILVPYVVKTIERQDPDILLGYDKAYRRSAEGKRTSKFAEILNMFIRMNKEKNVFNIFEDVQAAIDRKVLKKIFITGFGSADMLIFFLKNPILCSRLLALYLKYR